MKNHIKLILMSIMAGSVISCSDQFLDTISTDQYNEANWWQTENQAISSINGIYAVLRNTQFSAVQHLREENLTPNSYSMGGDSPLDVGAHNPGNVARVRDKWNACYTGIGRANDFLDNVDKVPMDEGLKNRLKGEAYFLRAFFYANLVSYYGGAPLILEAPDFTNHRDLPRNSRNDVVSQVLNDLDNAESLLPLSYSAPGRATQGAALALKTRVLLYEDRWSEAAQAAKAVMDLNQYELYPEYRGLFLLENENNEEVIFDVQYKTPEYTHGLDIIIELQINVAPTKEMVDSYLMSDGLSIQESPLFDPTSPYENRDPRLHQTVVIPGYMYRGGIVSDTKYFSTGYGYKKYTTYKDDLAQPSLLQSEINIILLRYGDVLLMYA
ncbi:MAG: RagB/SusD family nutrient uptake outer membrane protein, partial [Cyclobacteriaceae bacterium]